MAYLGKNLVNKADQCQVAACCNPGYYLKDEEILMCKKHGQSRIDFILSKKYKTPEDMIFIRKYIRELSSIMKKISSILPKKKN